MAGWSAPFEKWAAEELQTAAKKRGESPDAQSFANSLFLETKQAGRFTPAHTERVAASSLSQTKSRSGKKK